MLCRRSVGICLKSLQSLATVSTSTGSVQASPPKSLRASSVWPLLGRSAMFDFDGTLSIHCRHWSSSEQEWKSWTICSSARVGLTPFIKEYLAPSLSTKNRALRLVKVFRNTTRARRTAKASAKVITWSLPRLCHASTKEAGISPQVQSLPLSRGLSPLSPR